MSVFCMYVVVFFFSFLVLKKQNENKILDFAVSV